ncbi:MAG: hypothetical protein U0359_14070 [Byssovorax sp.]
MLSRDRPRVDAAPGTTIACSFNLDDHCKATEPNAPRWDYLLVAQGTSDRTVGVEVHPASAGEVGAVIDKRNWAQKKLASSCKDLIVGPSDWYWVASGKVFLRPTDPQFRRLRQSGIQGPTEHLMLRA